MKRILGFVLQNLRWFFLGIMYVFVCRAMYLDLKNVLPWYQIILACVLGLIGGLTMIIKVIDPFLKFSDNKIASWLRIKNPRA